MKNNWKVRDFVYLFIGMVLVVLLNHYVDEYSIYYRENHNLGKETNPSEIQLENRYWLNNPKDNQTTEPTTTPDDNYGVIESETMLRRTFFVCKDNVDTYGGLEARSDWKTGELYNGEIVKFSSVTAGHWALVSVNPVIEYVDMVNLCVAN